MVSMYVEAKVSKLELNILRHLVHSVNQQILEYLFSVFVLLTIEFPAFGTGAGTWQEIFVV